MTLSLNWIVLFWECDKSIFQIQFKKLKVLYAQKKDYPWWAAAGVGTFD